MEKILNKIKSKITRIQLIVFDESCNNKRVLAVVNYLKSAFCLLSNYYTTLL